MGAQTWLVVCCHQCKKFQTDQEKKAKKWQCKVCGEKQSLQRVYARSHSAKDCRLVVQQYNTARGAVEAEETEQALEEAYAEAEYEEYGYPEGYGSGIGEEAAGEELPKDEGQQEQQQLRPQRWLAYAGDEEDDGCTMAVPERAGKPKRSMQQFSGSQGTAACGGGGKRQRQQRQEQQQEGEGAGWGSVSPCIAPLGWEGAHQQPHQQQRPLGSQNRAPVAPAGHSWQHMQQQQQQQQPTWGQQRHTQQAQQAQQAWGQQPQQAWVQQAKQAWPQQAGRQQQNHQLQQPQPPWQQAGVSPQQNWHQKQQQPPLQGQSHGWQQVVLPKQQAAGLPAGQPAAQKQQGAGAASRWGTFLAEDDF